MSCQRYISVVLSAAALSVVVLFAAACGLQPVSSIRIKTSPELYVPLSAKSFSANEYISPTRFKDMLKSSKSSGREGQIYYYNPPNAKDPAQLRYLIHYPLQSIPVDVNNYFGKERADSVLSRSFDTSIDIPKIEKTVSSAIDSNEINTKLLKVFNERYSSPSPFVPSGGTAGDYPSLPAVPIKFTGFSRLIFEDSPDSALTISTASSANYVIASGTLTISDGSITGVPNGKSIRFPLAGRTILGNDNMQLQITIRRQDTTGGNVTITPELEGTIARVEGVTANLDVISLEEKQMDIALPEGFRSAKIGTGSLNLDVLQPPGWSGISISHKTHIKQEGTAGLNLAPTSFTQAGTPVNLAGQSLNTDTRLKYSSKLQVTLTDATYTRSDTPIQAECSVSIGKFETVTLAKRSDFKKAQDEPVPSDMKKWVQSIRIKKVTAKVVLTNNLPAENPININLKSTVFGIDGTDKHGTSGEFPAQEQNKEVKYPGKENFDLPITPETKFDLESTVLPGSSVGSDAYTLKNIETGKKVEFSGKVEFDIDWESMVVKADGGKGSSFPEGDLLRLPMVSKLKKAGIQLDKMPMYFYAGSDSNLFRDTEVRLDLSVEALAENGISTPTSLLKESHKLVPLPADAFKDAEGEEGKTKTLTKAVPEPMFTVGTLHETLNTYPDGIRFNYTISMENGVTITREEYKSAKANNDGDPAINVDLLLEIPIGFTVSSRGGELELYSATEAIDLKDSFNKLPIGEEQFKLRKLQLNANLENESGFTPAFILRIKNRENKELLGDKEISLAAGNQELKLTSEEWDKLKEAGAFIPELYLKLEPGKPYTVKKDAELKANLSVTVAADVDYKVY